MASVSTPVPVVVPGNPELVVSLQGPQLVEIHQEHDLADKRQQNQPMLPVLQTLQAPARVRVNFPAF